MLRRLLPVVGLVLLAPFVGEYLLGNVPVTELAALPVLAPMYGGGALLVREIARRTGRGWPAMLLLAAAYGLIEAGLIDQTLFNPPELSGGSGGAVAYLPALGFSAQNALSFIGGHVIWSICIPIAIVETFVPAERNAQSADRAQAAALAPPQRELVAAELSTAGRESEYPKPWLGIPGLVVVALIYLGGSWLVFDEIRSTDGFLARPAQLIGAALVALVFVVLAFVLPRRRPAIDHPAPRPWLAGVLALAGSSLFVLRPDSWLGVGLGVVALGVAAVMVDRWARRDGWDERHRLALAGGALLTYAWLGFLLNDLYGRQGSVYVIGQAVLDLCAIVLLIAAYRVVRKRRRAVHEMV